MAKSKLDAVAGRVGGGQVSFAGYITYGSTIGFDLTSHGTDIRFRYTGVSVTADQDLRLHCARQMHEVNAPALQFR